MIEEKWVALESLISTAGRARKWADLELYKRDLDTAARELALAVAAETGAAFVEFAACGSDCGHADCITTREAVAQVHARIEQLGK